MKRNWRILNQQVIFFLSIVTSSLFAQVAASDNLAQIKAIPPPPNAASLGKYGETPVGYYTGTPSISVPVHTISYGDIQLPISLDYHSGGIKVEEIASWVGLGWSLNAGGVITRTVRGIADEYSNIYPAYNYGSNVSQILSNTSPFSNAEITGGKVDTEPDIYYYNFAGHSGKFFIGEDGTTVYTIPQSKLSIKFSGFYSGGPTGSTISWVINTPDGFQYTFGYLAANGTDPAVDATEYNQTWTNSGSIPSSLVASSDQPWIISSWYLISVTSPKGFSIKFQYTQYNYQYTAMTNQTDYYYVLGMSFSNDQNTPLPPNGNRSSYSMTTNAITGRRLSSIAFPNGHVDFTAGAFRLDLNQDQVLSTISIYSGQGTSNLIKSFGLNYSYFNNPGNVQPPTSYSPWSKASEVASSKFRLKLLSVTESGSDGSSKPPYSFSYIENINLPPRLDQAIASVSQTSTAETYAQDHWGYYNGQLQNKNYNFNFTLVPATSLDFGSSGIHAFQLLPGANRASDDAYSTANTLNHISYPTGGSTDFTYESNKIPSNSFPTGYTYSAVPMVYQGCFLNTPANSATNSKTCTNATTGYAFAINSSEPDPDGTGAIGANLTVTLSENSTNSPSCSLSDDANGNVTVQIINTVTQRVYTLTASVASQPKFLPNGTYNMTISKLTSPCNSLYAVNLKWTALVTPQSQATPTDIQVGGLRVASITDYDGISHANDVIRNFSYKASNGLSSGVLKIFPVYGWSYYSQTDCSASGPTNVVFTTFFHVRHSYTNIPLATTQGSTIGYQTVTVTKGTTTGTNPTNGQTGKTVYTYTTESQYPDVVNQSFPFPPTCSFDWKRGLLTGQTEFNFNSTTQTSAPVRDKTNHYTFYSDPVAGSASIPITMGGSGNSLSQTFSFTATYGGIGYLKLGILSGNVIASYTGLISGKINLNSNGCGAAVIPFNVPSAGTYSFTITLSLAGNQGGAGASVGACGEIDYPLAPTYIPPLVKNTIALKLGIYGIGPSGGCTIGNSPTGLFMPYSTRTEWYVNDAVTTTQYDETDQTQTFKQVDTYTFNNPVHQQVTSHAVQSSESNTLQTDYYTYPLDYNLTSTTPGIKQLQMQNIVGEVIEKYTTITPQGGSPVVTGGEVNSYIVNPLNPTMAVKDNTYLLEFKNPIPTTGTGMFTPLTTNTTALTPDSRYQSRMLYSYDAKGNLIQNNKPGDVVSSYLWSYNQALPIAEAVNANSNQIYYQSFEDQTGANILSPGHCGKNFYGAAYSPTFVIPDGRTYVVEYWSLSGNTWTFNTATYTGTSMTLGAGSNGVDDVRIYPKDAQMKSYTYDPVKGMTSIIDESGRAYMYDYDPYGRLLQIRNDKGYIEKKYQYHYKGN